MLSTAAAQPEPATWIHQNPLAISDSEKQDDNLILAGDGPPSLHKVTRPRGQRRRIKARANRGVRPDPTDSEEARIALKTTPWFKRRKREVPQHPRYHRTKLVLVPDENGRLVTDVSRAYPKPAPNRRRTAGPIIETDIFSDVATAMKMRPEEELNYALARREMSLNEQEMFHRDALEVSGIMMVTDGLPPFTHREFVLH